MPIHQNFPTFNSGVLSPYLLFRGDFAKHAGGAEVMDNFLPIPFGSFTKRPGTVFLRKTQDGGENSKLLPFVAAGGEKYLLHFTEDRLKVYREDGTTADTLDFMLGYNWAAAADNIRALKIEGINDIAFLSHPGTFPLELQRVNDTDWKLKFISFDRAPMLDDNTKKTKTFTVASNPVADTWANGEDYEIGFVVFTDSEWECTADHHASSDDKPGSGDNWRDFWKRKFYVEGDPVTILSDDRSEVAWNPASPYSEFDVVSYLGNFYICGITSTDVHYPDHLPVGTADQYDPLSVVYLREYWHAIGPAIPGSWTTYQLGWYDGNVYQAYPGGGTTTLGDTGFADTWALYTPAIFRGAWVNRSYQAGIKRARGGRVYQAILDHVPDATNRPGTGANWQTYWVEISRIVQAFEASNFSPGQYFKISPERDDQDFQIELAAIDDNDQHHTEPIAVHGAWNFFTYGIWHGTYQLQRSANGGKSWRAVRSWQASGDRNVADSGTEDTPVLLRLKFSKDDDTAASGKQRGVLIPESPYVTGYALADTYVSADEMTGFAQTAMLSGNTWRWAEGAFNSRDGYPRAMALHERRLVFASTQSLPISIWLSASGDPLDFETGTNDDRGMFRTLFATAAEPIVWMISQRRLILGTTRGEWVCGSETQDTGLTPTNFNARQMTGIGSEGLQSLAINDTVIFIGRKGARVHELQYADRSYGVQDLSTLAEHLTLSGITSMAWQQNRHPGLWAVCGDGTLVHLAYNPSQEISAWTRHFTQTGIFRDVVTFPAVGGDDDVFLMVDRGGDSFLERFPVDWLEQRETGTLQTALDSTVFTTPFPSHFTGRTVRGLADGLPFTTTSPPGAADVVAGIIIAARLKLMPIDTTTDTGTTHGRRKRANEMVLNVAQSWGGGITYNGEDREFVFSMTQDTMGAPIVPFTGWMAVTVTPGHVVDLQPEIYHADIYPFTCRAAVVRWQIHEP